MLDSGNSSRTVYALSPSQGGQITGDLVLTGSLVPRFCQPGASAPAASPLQTPDLQPEGRKQRGPGTFCVVWCGWLFSFVWVAWTKWFQVPTSLGAGLVSTCCLGSIRASRRVLFWAVAAQFWSKIWVQRSQHEVSGGQPFLFSSFFKQGKTGIAAPKDIAASCGNQTRSASQESQQPRNQQSKQL